MTSTPPYSTPFQDRLGTNYAPTEKEIPEIQRLVREVESTKAQLTAEMDALKARVDACSSFVSAHLALLSPVHRIPSDILINIFLLCIPPMWSEKVATPLEAPLLLTQVCREWCDLVRKTPSFWSKLHISIPQYPSEIHWHSQGAPKGLVGDEEDLLDVEDASDAEEASLLAVRAWHRRMERKISLARLWLLRGVECPLSLSITAPQPLPGTADKEEIGLDALILLFSEYASRWMHLQISAVHPRPARLLSLSSSQVPQLQAVSLKWLPDYTGMHTLPPTHECFPSDSIINAPRLRHLAIESFGGHLSNAGVQWGGITKLCIIGFPSVRGLDIEDPDAGYVSPYTALFLLQQCPNMVEFCINISKDVDALSTTPSLVQAHGLRCLIVHENTQLPAFGFFDSLDLPALRSLTFSSTSNYSDITTHDERPSILSLLRKIGSNIDYLEFGFLSLSIPDVTRCLVATPNVKELVLDLSGGLRATVLEITSPSTPPNPRNQPPYYLRNDLLASLIPILGGEDYLCPSLTTVKIQTRVVTELASKAVFRLVFSRRNEAILKRGVAKLERCIIRFMDTYAGPHMLGKSPRPARWSEARLNESLGQHVIQVQWWQEPWRSSRRSSNPFEGWWDSRSDDFIA
ncbi:hypothetical protein BKA70DRAFT_1396209 [Coprinopsis sp. MPI-PUGE-AT-0042]|nr:hypothetical protein BKA70DRAFT_1396209 [Coprinopsis sp. MPI-PUGE-AT-0042]